METLEKNIVQVVIDGKNVTEDVSPYLSRLSYTDKVEAESDDVTLVFEDVAGYWQNGWYPQQGDSLTVTIGSPGNPLDCGIFEIDEVELEFPPDTVTVRGIGTAISKALRTKNSKAFEKQSLLKIAQYFAKKHGLTITGNTSELQKIEIERKTQDRQTDLSFLADLAKEYGIVFSVRGSQLIFIDIEELEKKPAILTIHKNEISRARFADKTSQIYGSAVVATRNMKTNSVRRWNYTPPKGDVMGVLVSNAIKEKVAAENETQAQAKAKGALKDKNKDKITGSLTVEGNVKLVAGINIELVDIGTFSGKWHVVSSSHSIDNSMGYVTDVAIRKIEKKEPA